MTNIYIVCAFCQCKTITLYIIDSLLDLSSASGQPLSREPWPTKQRK